MLGGSSQDWSVGVTPVSGHCPYPAYWGYHGRQESTVISRMLHMPFLEVVQMGTAKSRAYVIIHFGNQTWLEKTQK
jgi:CRISPR/Cas system CSM-associated protein Csm3 (group 7 of RAMP superfamily)